MQIFKPPHFRRFRQDESGGTSVEFVLVFPIVFFFVIFIFMLAIDFFWLLTSQKAVETAAREAITRLPVATQLVEHGRVINYEGKSGTNAGEPCEPGDGCEPIQTYSCRGGSHLGSDCDVTRFNQIYAKVVDFAPLSINPSELTIRYEDSRLGRASESYIPLVTVELTQTRVLKAFDWIESAFDVGEPTTSTVAVTLVGEYLGN